MNKNASTKTRVNSNAQALNEKGNITIEMIELLRKRLDLTDEKIDLVNNQVDNIHKVTIKMLEDKIVSDKYTRLLSYCAIASSVAALIENKVIVNFISWIGKSIAIFR